MKYRRLGKTGMRVSIVGLGTWQFGGEWGKTFTIQEVDKIMRTAASCGINLVDTAECYGNHLSESLIGRCIKDTRSNWVIATKFGHTFHDFMNRSDAWGVREVQHQLEDSLRALRTDYIDLYQFHSGDDEAFGNSHLWEMLDKQVRGGKIRHLGISISRNASSSHQVRSAGRVGAETIQVMYNRLNRQPEKEILKLCRKQCLGVLARVPLASGYLSGKYDERAVFSDDDVRSTHDRELSARQLQEVAVIGKTEVPEGMSMAQWAIAWCLKHHAVSTVIPGCKNAEQVKINAGAADLDMIGTDHPQEWV